MPDLLTQIAAIIDPAAFDIRRAYHYCGYSPAMDDPDRVKRRRIALAKAERIVILSTPLTEEQGLVDVIGQALHDTPFSENDFILTLARNAVDAILITHHVMPKP